VTKKKNSVATKGAILIDMRTEFSCREQSSYQNHKNQAPDTTEQTSEHWIQTHKFIIDKAVFEIYPMLTRFKTVAV
jgi:hypothetical protein